MATTITSIEKQYPDFIFHLSTGKQYKVCYLPPQDNRWHGGKIRYVTTKGEFTDNCPNLLRPYSSFFTHLSYYSKDDGALKILDSISSLPNFDMLHFDIPSFNRFLSMTFGVVNAKTIIKWYTEYGNRILSDDFFTNEILPSLYPLTEEERAHIPQTYNRNYIVQFYQDSKFRHLYMKAIENPASYFFSTDKIVQTITQFLKDCEDLEIKVPTGDFWRNAKYTRQTAEQKRKQIEAMKFLKSQTQYDLSFEDENFCVVVPTTYEECAAEGAAMRNCMGGYEWDNYLSSGIRKVVFVREKSDPTVPCVDIDMTGDLSLRQVRSSHNTTDWERNPDLKDFVKNYARHLKSLLD